VLNLLTSPRTVGTVRSLLGTVADAVRSVVAPATLVEHTEAPAIVEAPDPAGLYEADEIPAVEDIERAALGYDLAADSARSADRAKRKHKKLLDRLPSGLYGGWLISRTPSNRQVADLDQIRATYEGLGLGPIPMRQASPSLKVTRAEAALVDVETAVLATV
jgi:hypothetical protein